jgi:hypothetical protein
VATGTDLHPERDDLSKLLGLNEDEAYHQQILDGAVPISGAEGLNLLCYPHVLGELTPDDWPANVQIDVVVPEGDQWVSRDGQKKLVTEVLHTLTNNGARLTSVPGGHLPLGKQDSATQTVADMIIENRPPDGKK